MGAYDASKWFDQIFLKENSLERGDKGDGGSSANKAARLGGSAGHHGTRRSEQGQDPQPLASR